MIPKELNDWLQVVGLFGLIAGLVFVGIELRLARQVALTEAQTSAYDQRVQFVELIAQYSDVWRRGSAGEVLSPPDQTLFDNLAGVYALGAFGSFDRASRLGRTPPHRQVRLVAEELIANPGLRDWWEDANEKNRRLDSEPFPVVRWDDAIRAEIERLERSSRND